MTVDAAHTASSSLPASCANTAMLTILQAESDDPGVQRLHQLHQSLLSSINGAHSQTSQLLQSQEHDLLSAFQTRLLELHNELLQERQKAEVGSSEWIQRCQTLTQQSQLLQAKHHQLQQSHSSVKEKLLALQREYRLLEETRDILVKNLVVLKRQLHQQQQLPGSEPSEEWHGSQPAYLRSRPVSGSRTMTSTRPATASRSNKPSMQQRPFTASMHSTRSPPRWSREWNDRPHSAAVGAAPYSQSVHQRPAAAVRHTQRSSVDTEISVEQHYKQLLAVAHQQQEKSEARYEQLHRRYRDRRIQEKELSMCVRQALYRLFQEPGEPLSLKSILQRPASSGARHGYSTVRPSSAASLGTAPSRAPAPPSVMQLSSEQRTAVLHQLALEPVFWNFIDSIANKLPTPTQSKPSDTDGLKHAKAHAIDVQSRLQQLLLADSDDELSQQDSDEDVAFALTPLQEHKDSGDT